MGRYQGRWVIVLSFFCSFILAVIPLPAEVTLWRPDWCGLVLIYWCLALPERVGIVTGWAIGILHDVLSDTLLGRHALTLCLIAYLSVKLHRQIRLFALWQQAISIGILIAISKLLEAWIQGLVNHPHPGWSFLYPAVTSMLLWPWLFIILRDMQRIYRVS